MAGKMGRREFLGKAAVAALTAPVLLQGSLKVGHAADGPPGAPKQGATPMKRIAVEEHWSSPEVRVVEPSIDPKSVALAPVRAKDIEQFRLPLMNEYGIKMQVLNATSPQVDAAAEVAAFKKTNDALAEQVKKYPGRFAGFAALPMQNPGVAADELERAVTQLGFKGAMLKGTANGEFYDLQKFWVVWERAEGLGVPIYLHPAGAPIPESKKLYEGRPELNGPIWSWTVETATDALRIIASGLFDTFPKSTLILGHLGEALPFLLGRFDEGYAMSIKSVKLKKPFSQYIKDNIIVTTSGKYKPEALLCAIGALGADRVLFAVDYPWVTPKEGVECFENTPMSDSDREKIYHLNAERLLKL
jgi:predicted TIM-barrel fold metal-dependent hydrolase